MRSAADGAKNLAGTLDHEKSRKAVVVLSDCEELDDCSYEQKRGAGSLHSVRPPRSFFG